MEFGHPSLLVHLCWLIPLMIGFHAFAWAWRRRAMERFGELGILSRLTLGRSRSLFWGCSSLLILSILLITVASARPRWGTVIKKTERKGVHVFIAVDVSLSMQAKDIPPSRLEKAKRELRSLIDRLEGDKIGLIAFAGTSFVQCPLTLDYDALKLFLDTLSPDQIPLPGTNMAEAIDRALKSFKTVGKKHRVLVLLTDGEDHSGRLEESVKRAKEEGLRILTIGIGDPKGEPIPIYDENGASLGHKKDMDGQVVMSKLDETSLQKMALETGGLYFRATTGEIEAEKIAEAISGMEKEDLSSREASHKEERFQIPLALALVLLLTEMALREKRSEA